MNAIGLEDLLGRERYGAERDAIRRRIIEHKRSRRVRVGDRISLLFEDRATVWYQTQEMLWVEHITDLDAIRDELAVYGALLPGRSRAVGDAADRDHGVRAASGTSWDACAASTSTCGSTSAGERVAGVFETGRESESKLSAVQYVRFPLAAATRAPAGRRRGADDRRRPSRVPLLGPRCRRPFAAVSWRSWTTPRPSCAALRRVRDG